MFRFPWGDFHSLNLGWFLQKFNELLEDWATAEAGIDGALDAEIQKAEDALTDVFDARDAAAASATAAAGSASAAGTSATAAQNSATLANNKATAAGLSEAAAAQSATAASNSATAAATSATQAGNSATAAAGSATQASQSATNAAGSATQAGQSATNAAGSASAAAGSATAAAASAARAEEVEESIPEDYSDLSNDVIELQSAIDEITETVEPTEYAIISPDYEWGIPNDMSVVYNNDDVTFSYPHESGNKANFGFWFPNLVNGKTYVARFEVLSGGLASENQIQITALTSSFGSKNSIASFTKNGNIYSCEFIASLAGDHAYNALRLSMLRSISTTVTISNISVKEKNATTKLLVNAEAVSQFPTNPCDYKGTEISLFHKIICVGDSLTQGVCNYVYQGTTYINRAFPNYAYPTFLKKITGCDVTNAGQAGVSIEEWYTNHSGDDLSGHDAAIIQLGVNNASGGWTQAAETALGNIITKLKTENNGIKIFVATIIPDFAYSGANYDVISAGIREFVEDLDDPDVILLDMAVYGHTAEETAYNNGHLTAIGYLRLAEDYKSYISNVVALNLINFRFIQLIGTNYTPY